MKLHPVRVPPVGLRVSLGMTSLRTLVVFAVWLGVLGATEAATDDVLINRILAAVG